MKPATGRAYTTEMGTDVRLVGGEESGGGELVYQQATAPKLPDLGGGIDETETKTAAGFREQLARCLPV